MGRTGPWTARVAQILLRVISIITLNQLLHLDLIKTRTKDLGGHTICGMQRTIYSVFACCLLYVGGYAMCFKESDQSLAELLTLTREVDADGTIRYLNSAGRVHRIHGPAEVYIDGTEFWCQLGQIHRTNGPAVIRPGQYETWYKMDLRHRADGPAMILADGSVRWFLEGIEYSESEWEQVVDIMNEYDQSPGKREV